MVFFVHGIENIDAFCFVFHAQFSPQDPEKIMITSADGKVRIYDGFELVNKYRGTRQAHKFVSSDLDFMGYTKKCFRFSRRYRKMCKVILDPCSP